MADEGTTDNATQNTEPATPPPPPPPTPPTEAPNPLLEYPTEVWNEKVEDWTGRLDALIADFRRVAGIKSMPRSRRGAMLRSLMHSTMTGINNDIRMRTEGRPATKIYDV